MRQATDTVRAKNGMEPLTSDLSLSRTALYLATELGKKDQKEAEVSPELEKALLERAKAYGFAVRRGREKKVLVLDSISPPVSFISQGTSVKAQVFTYDAKAMGLTAKDSEAHALAAVNYWASKDATAGLEGEREEEMEGEKDATSGVSYTLLGSAGVIAPSGQAYITQVYGASG